MLGYLFGVDESTARRGVRDVPGVLERLAAFPLEMRTGQPRGRGLEAVLDAYPEVTVLLDSREQRIRRPTGGDAQKPFYSGKKKTHTLKMQAAVSVGGWGYVGIGRMHPEEACWIPVKKPPGGTLTDEEKAYNRSLAPVRVGVEHLFARMSRFGAMTQVFRHRRERHSGIVRVAAWLADRQIAACPAHVSTV